MVLAKCQQIQNRTFIGGVMRYAIATLRADYDPTYAVKNVVERRTESMPDPWKNMRLCNLEIN